MRGFGCFRNWGNGGRNERLLFFGGALFSVGWRLLVRAERSEHTLPRNGRHTGAIAVVDVAGFLRRGWSGPVRRRSDRPLRSLISQVK